MAAGSADGGGHLVGLMVEYQAGHMDAFERLYVDLAPDLRRHLEAASWDGVGADLVQETFLALHRSRHTYTPPLPVRPWVFGIARNVLRRHRRDAWRRGRIVDPAAVVTDQAAPQGTGGHDVGAALGSLPAGKRQAFLLHHVHGFSFAEIARMMGIPAGAAKLRSSRAMAMLRALLGRDEGERR